MELYVLRRMKNTVSAIMNLISSKNDEMRAELEKYPKDLDELEKLGDDTYNYVTDLQDSLEWYGEDYELFKKLDENLGYLLFLEHNYKNKEFIYDREKDKKVYPNDKGYEALYENNKKFWLGEIKKLGFDLEKIVNVSDKNTSIELDMMNSVMGFINHRIESSNKESQKYPTSEEELDKLSDKDFYYIGNLRDKMNWYNKEQNLFTDLNESMKSLYDLETNYSKHFDLYDKSIQEYVHYGDARYDKVYNELKNNLINSGKKLGVDIDFLSKDYTGFTDDDIKLETSKEKVMNKVGIGGQHFTPNLLDEYVTFRDGNILYVIGNFTDEWIKENYDQIFSEDELKNIRKVRCFNKLENGTTPLYGLNDVKVKITRDGIEVIGDVDDLKYHSKEVKKDEVLKENEEKDDKDYSGLDVIPDEPSLADKKEEKDKKKPAHMKEGVEPTKGKKVKARHAKPSLLQKFKNLKTWQKALIIAGGLATAGVGIFVAGPHIMEAINNLINPDNVNTASQTMNMASGTLEPTSLIDQAQQGVSSLDYSAIGGEGHQVFTNAHDAVSGANGLVSNQWFSDNPVDVFNTATNSYMGLSPEQLNDPNLMAELAKNPDNAMLFGNSVSDPSGFIPLDEVASTIHKVK